jgi:hypothetical protein
MASYEDANGDGFLDLILHFETWNLGAVFDDGGDRTLYLLGKNGGTPLGAALLKRPGRTNETKA